MLSRNLVAYLVSRFCSASAMTMLRAAIAWHVFKLTGSAFHLGLIGLVQFASGFSLMLVGGAVADAHDRRRIMMIAQLVPLGCAAVLFYAARNDAVHVGMLYALVAVIAVAAAFDSPARAALLPTIVPRAIFPRAVTLGATNQALAFTSGPAIGGLLIAEGGVAAAYAAYALLLCGSLTGLLLLRPDGEETARRTVTVAAIREGLAFVRRRQVVLGCMLLDMFAVVCAGATALLPIYANDILHVGARGYGLLSSSLELGALVSSLFLATRRPIHHGGPVLFGTVTAYGLATILFGLSRWFPLSVAAYMLVGVADQVSVVIRATIIQLSTPDELRGRVSSVSMIFIGASNQLGAAESGFVAALTSAPFAVVSGGIACLLVVVAIASRMPELRRYRLG
jgi:MFS family permease